MKKYIFHTAVTIVLTIISFTTFAQASLDTIMFESDKIICYKSKTPGDGNYLPSMITNYIMIIDRPDSFSNESPENKVERMKKFIETFSLSEAKSSEQQLFMSYVAHLIICNPRSKNYRDDRITSIIEDLTQSSKKSIKTNATLVKKLINDYGQLN